MSRRTVLIRKLFPTATQDLLRVKLGRAGFGATKAKRVARAAFSKGTPNKQPEVRAERRNSPASKEQKIRTKGRLIQTIRKEKEQRSPAERVRRQARRDRRSEIVDDGLIDAYRDMVTLKGMSRKEA